MGEQTAASLVRASFPEAVAERRFLTFRVADQCYALPGEEVSEIILIPPVARLPHSPKSLMGLANLRGSVLPMIDLRSLLGRGAFTQSVNSRAIVLTGASPIALAVDTVDALVALKTGQVETRQTELAAEQGEALRGTFQSNAGLGVTKILDLPAMLAVTFSGRPTRERAPPAVSAPVTAETVIEIEEGERLLLSFAVAGQDYALALESVREIVPVPDTITVVPRAEAVLLGVISYRDILLPLLSLRGLLGFAASERSDGDEKVIVIPVRGVLVGLVADRVRAIIPARPAQIDTAPSMLAARAGGESKITAIFRGDGGRHLVSVLAPEHLFREDVMRRLGDPSAAASSQPEVPTQNQRNTIAS
jgi:purine-binding chemotaxis protein CheW